MDIDEIRNNDYFWFLNNKDLEEELNLCYAYMLFLIDTLESMDDKTTPSHILFSTSHNIVTYQCAILEAILHEYVYQYFEKCSDKDASIKFCKIITYKEVSEEIPKKDNPKKVLVYCEKGTKYQEYKTKTQLNSLIKWCKEYKLLPKTTLEKLDNIRLIRNWIHLNALMDAKDIFTYSDLNAIRDDVSSIFKKIKNKVKRL